MISLMLILFVVVVVLFFGSVRESGEFEMWVGRDCKNKTGQKEKKNCRLAQKKRGSNRCRTTECG